MVEQSAAAQAERSLQAACIASAAAAAIHFGTAPAHLEEYGPSGLFMITAGLAQACWVLLVMMRTSARLLFAAVAGNLALIGTWAMTRTTGLPFGPMAWQAEDVHSNDSLAVGLELLVVFACLVQLDARLPNPARRMRAIAVTGALLSVMVSSHDPAREHIVAAAALLLIVVATRFAQAAPELLAIHRPIWRSHVFPAFARRRVSVLDPAGSAAIGTR